MTVIPALLTESDVSDMQSEILQFTVVSFNGTQKLLRRKMNFAISQNFRVSFAPDCTFDCHFATQQRI